MAAQMLAYCGLDCAECEAFLATKTNDDSLRLKFIERWASELGGYLSPKDVNCDGCTTSAGRQMGQCRECPIRKCAVERGVDNCAHCADYACSQLRQFFNMAPTARHNLDRIREQTHH